MNTHKLFLLILLNISLKTVAMTADLCLLEAARLNDLGVVKQLLNIYKDININTQCPIFKNSALHLSVLRKNVDMTKALLQRGAQPNIQNYQGKTPLHIAMEKHAGVAIINSLINNGANVLIQDHNQKIPTDHLDENQKQLLPIFLATFNQQEKKLLNDKQQDNNFAYIKEKTLPKKHPIFMFRIHANVLNERLIQFMHDNPTINHLSTTQEI